jgi:uncharacterized protein YndB with AHSA1/START domain
MHAYRLAIALLFVQSYIVSAEPAPAPPTLDYDVYIVGSATKVWDALTVKEQVDQYSMCPQQRCELRVGGAIAYGTPARTLLQGKILALTENSHIRYTLAMTDGVVTTVDIQVEPVTPAVTHLTLEQTSAAWTEKDQADYRDGWPIILSGLKTLIETGKPIPWKAGSPAP